MPFRKLPVHTRSTPEVHTAWLESHSERLDILESRPSQNEASTSTASAGKQGLLSPTITRPIVLSLLFLTAVGVIPLEKAIKLIAILIRLSLG